MLEGEEARKEACAGLREALSEDRALPLGKLLERKHPAETMAGAAPGVYVSEAAPEDAVYFDECRCLGAFLLDRYGAGFVRHLVKTVAKGGDLGKAIPWLRRNRRKLPERETPPPEDLEALEEAFFAWARAG
jgi:hypothetical protein